MSETRNEQALAKIADVLIGEGATSVVYCSSGLLCPNPRHYVAAITPPPYGYKAITVWGSSGSVPLSVNEIGGMISITPAMVST